jgi:SAM-dependent methyltransferase
VLVPLLRAEHVPVFCNVQCPAREQALSAPQAQLEIVVCAGCGHAHNTAFDSARVAYSPAYDNSQHFSSTFREYASRLVDRLVDTYSIRHKAVVDIGCGRGDLLALLAARGGNRGFGFDPSYDPNASEASRSGVTISGDYFGHQHAADIRPTLVCCRHVLEHIFEPLPFLVGLREAISAGGAPLLYLEVPNGDHLLRSAGLWDYIYEHYSYFSRRSLEIVLRAAGFDVLRIFEDFGGQFLCAEARPHPRVGTDPLETGPVTDVPALEDAVVRMRAKLDGWHAWADGLDARGQAATIWGAGSKGVMFLNLLGLSAPAPIDFVIDQNPHKAGRYLAVSGQVVMPPSHLVANPVSEVVVMNDIYLGEIKAQLATMGSTALVVTV